MKRILTVLVMITGIIAVLFWAAPIGVCDSESPATDSPDNGTTPVNASDYVKRVVYEAELVCLFASNPDQPATCEDCGGRVQVYTSEGETYVEFDFMAPPPPSFSENQDYQLYMEVIYADEDGRKELPIGEFLGCNGIEDTDIDPIVVSTDENGVCHTGPVLLDLGMYYECAESIPGMEAPDGVTGPIFSVRVAGWMPPTPPDDISGLECGAWLSTGF